MDILKEKRKNKKGAGRPEFQVTDIMRKQVETQSGFGVPQEQIAAMIGCSVETLVKHFPNEVLTGKGKANTKIAQTLYNKAVGGDTSALIFWAKTQMKWSEQIEVKQEINVNDISEAKAKLLAGIKDE